MTRVPDYEQQIAMASVSRSEGRGSNRRLHYRQRLRAADQPLQLLPSSSYSGLCDCDCVCDHERVKSQLSTVRVAHAQHALVASLTYRVAPESATIFAIDRFECLNNA
eukprot:CAMPEP_0179837714 /NCGR_PEP_ID=MMETSP0982-20121206/203_1 /TAXON_ID=483367 /ORGANISM="non described non described, Strain CCMP 2436" /LENGTH=107 /DNA_ID=CAMNT_0021720863 /DNA_START=42 /DNA_END=366 /DNA_ORIENTATION=-